MQIRVVTRPGIFSQNESELNPSLFAKFCLLALPPHLKDDTNQVGDTCKIVAFIALIKCEVMLNDILPSQSEIGRMLNINSLLSIARSKSVNSKVGELYTKDQFLRLSDEAAFPLNAHIANTPDEYINSLKELLDKNKAAIVIFNVDTESEPGFPSIQAVEETSTEHAATAVGYVSTCSSKPCTHFIVYHWQKYWLYDAPKLAQSALSLRKHLSEHMIKMTYQVSESETIGAWVNVKYAQLCLFNPKYAIDESNLQVKTNPASSSLRGTIFSAAREIVDRKYADTNNGDRCRCSCRLSNRRR